MDLLFSRLVRIEKPAVSRMVRSLWAVIAMITVWGGVSGCGTMIEQQPAANQTMTSNLLKPNIPPDAVTFDILIIRVPYSERYLLDELWEDVDEQEVTAEVRRRLDQNGFRAGILGATMPDSLSKLMALKGKGIRQTVEEQIPTETDPNTSMTLSKVETLQPGNKCVIQTIDEPIDRIPVLSGESKGLTGKIYEKAEPKIAVTIRNIPDGSVAFDLTPFFTFGDAQMVTKYKYSQMLRSLEQPTKTFDSLRCTLPLRPGQFLVIGPSNVKTTGLGHYFFAQGVGDYEQQIVVIRLLFTQHDERFYHFPGFQEILDKKIQDEQGKDLWGAENKTGGSSAPGSEEAESNSGRTNLPGNLPGKDFPDAGTANTSKIESDEARLY